MPETATRGATIRMDDVRFSYGETSMHFDFSLAAGRLVAIVGPSGSGKSTLLNLIAGFETPQAGRVIIADQDATHLPPAARPVSMVFQENNLFAHLDIESNAGLGRQQLLDQSGLSADALDLLALFDAFEADRDPFSFRDLILARKYSALLISGTGWGAVARSIHRSARRVVRLRPYRPGALRRPARSQLAR